MLYTTYLQTLGALHPPSSGSQKRAVPPLNISHTFLAGLTAGSLQSLLAAPLDALQVRFKTNDLLSGRYPDMWRYAWHRMRELGPRGIFAGWALTWLRDGLGCAAFFATFEAVKAQGLYTFVTAMYDRKSVGTATSADCDNHIIRPHFAIEPLFLLFAGVSASLVQQILQYPLGMVAEVHYQRIKALDRLTKQRVPIRAMLKAYTEAYSRTYNICFKKAHKICGLYRWLYRGFMSNAIRQIPSTSAGLIIFELVRRWYADDNAGAIITVNGNGIALS